jgi:hypothetical protein
MKMSKSTHLETGDDRRGSAKEGLGINLDLVSHLERLKQDRRALVRKTL